MANRFGHMVIKLSESDKSLISLSKLDNIKRTLEIDCIYSVVSSLSMSLL